MTWYEIVYDILTYLIFTYSGVLLLFYVFIGLFSIGETKKYLNKNSFTDYTTLASSQYLPSLSILAPAYNEGANIIVNVRSLLSIYYSNLEVVIINDGSKDDSLEKLIKAYDLEKVDFFVRYQIPTKEVKGVYKSRNPVYKKLVVVDKVNGGKADALNVGVNIASNDYIVCIDVDCVLEQDALLKLVKPFIEETETKVIATGGVVRIANSCVIEHGKLLKVVLPKDYLPRMQTLEYIRAFLLGRMAWSRLNGLLLISGAFGAFDKEIVIKCGGYDHTTVGEDMELVVRMRRYMEESGQKNYRVAFIPDPLCWTEAPVNYKILGRQRNRWTRGTIETLKMHKKMFFNPKYGKLGMISYPYWFFFEMCAPLIEFFGFIALLIMAFAGVIDWSAFMAFLIFIICFGYVYSAFAIFMEVITYNQYKKRTDVLKLLLTAITEPFVFHPFVVWSGITGYVSKIKKQSSWGEMTRTGLGSPDAKVTPAIQPAPVQVAEPIVEEEKKKSKTGLRIRLTSATKEFASYLFVFIILFLLIRVFEFTANLSQHQQSKDISWVITAGVIKDLLFVLSSAIWFYTVFVLLYLVYKPIARGFTIFSAIAILILQASLVQYFLTTLSLLGADVWAYSWSDIKQTIGASGSLNELTIIVYLSAIVIVALLFLKLPAKIKFNKKAAVGLILTTAICAALNLASVANSYNSGSEFNNNLSTTKTHHFIKQTIAYLAGEDGIDIYSEMYAGSFFEEDRTITYIDEQQYPFLHAADTTDVLGPFFNKTPTPPNIIFIVVEGLGRAFSNNNAYLGSWTPFLDSISNHSLYWENFISASGRTFGLLPSLTASLPYGKSGFAEMQKMPQHISLMSILQKNGYSSSFYYGGDSRFDNMNKYLLENGVKVNDQFNFPSGYFKMPVSSQGFSWGYGDKELARRYISDNKSQPFIDIILTVSTHSPFLINEQASYLNKYEEHLKLLGLNAKKEMYDPYKLQYASILYADDAVRNLVNQYKKKPGFSNTVFIITGDHRMPEIPIKDKLDRYHVPFIIYSPLLKRTAIFSSISTHLDVIPTLLNWLRKDYNLQTPSTVSWLGTGIDTARNFRNIHNAPLMQTKLEMVDQVMGEYLLNNNILYRITSKMDVVEVSDEEIRKKAEALFTRFKIKNQKLTEGAKLIPDSIYIRFK